MCLKACVAGDERRPLFAPATQATNCKSYRSKGQPRSTKNEFPIRADFGNSRKHPIWRLKRGGKLTAKGAVLSPEKRDFTVLLTKFAFIVTFEEFLVLYSEQSFYKCLINLSCPAGRHYRRKWYRPTGHPKLWQHLLACISPLAFFVKLCCRT